MTIADFLKLSRANALLIILCTLFGMGAGFGYAQTQARLYEASATALVVVSSGDAFTANSVAQQKAKAFAKLVETRAIGEAVLETVSDGNATLVGSVEDSTPIITITAAAQDPQRAAYVANAAITALGEEVTRLEELSQKGVEGAAGNDSVGGAATTVVGETQIVPLESAVAPTVPVAPNVKKILAVSTFLGLIIGYSVTFLRRALDSRIRHADDVEELLGTSLLGVIPESSDLGHVEKGQLDSLSEAAESMRQLRTNLRFIDVDRPPRVIVVTSANPGEGKSTISAVLAQMLAASGQRTVLVDCDLRRPMVAYSFGLESAIGLTQILTGEVDLVDAAQMLKGQPDLRVITAGRIPPNPSEMLGSQRMHNLLKRLSEEATVILDAPPLLPVTDAGLLAAVSDGAVLVVRAGTTRREQAVRCSRLLEQVGARQLGTVLNRVKRRHVGSGYYGYGYGYGYKAYTSTTSRQQNPSSSELRSSDGDGRIRHASSSRRRLSRKDLRES